VGIDVAGRAVDALAAVAPFDRLTPEAIERTAEYASWRDLASGDLLSEAGDDATELAVVVEGTLDVEVPAGPTTSHRVAELGPGDVVGEVALLVGGRRTADVRARTPVRVVVLTADGFDALLEAAPELGTLLADAATARLRQTQVITHLTRLFPDLPRQDLDDLLAAVEVVPLPAGATLFAQGDPPDAAYVVLSGRLRVLQHHHDEVHSLGELSAGEVFGELALLDGEPRSATVLGVRDAVLATLPRAAVGRLVEAQPSVALALTRHLVARIRTPAAARRPVEGHRSIVVLPHGDGPDAHRFATLVAERLGAEAQHVSSASMDRVLGHPGASDAERGTTADVRLTHWLSEVENDHRWLVYETDPTWTRWTERACRQGDELVVVASADAEDVAPGAVERHLDDGATATRTLVLVHGHDVDQPTSTSRWVEHREVDRLLHVRRGDPVDLDRLVRILTGRATGLVLGGGGARGAAHLGVLRALHAAGVVVDRYGGSSIGAVMALGGALELPDDEVVPYASRMFKGLLDYTLPLVSLLKGKRITDAIDEATGGRDIEDLRLPYFCISTNLTRQVEVVHERGPLARAVRASVAIPGVLPPVPYGEDLLIDGGSMNNLPVDRMRDRLPEGTVIAVDVAPPRGPAAKSDFVPVVSGWGQLGRRMTPGMRPLRVPGVATTILASTIVSAMRDRNRVVEGGLADLYLDLDLRGHGLLDFDDTAEIAAAGYDAAMPRIEAWLADGPGAAER
jgi:predicted acylesterase/phospholipase RssA/CRP-like cAMP-binding protein